MSEGSRNVKRKHGYILAEQMWGGWNMNQVSKKRDDNYFQTS